MKLPYWKILLEQMQQGSAKALARCISLIENEAEGYLQTLADLKTHKVPVIGITGPPGAGKSTITDALISTYIKDEKKVAIICVDPSSPFNMGAILGDRIRMNQWYKNENIFIRSIATRGSLGGLSSKIIEICDLLKSAYFDIIIVETVGIGQSEIEIAGLADVTIVALVPESGDEVQAMKSGMMEIADIFAVNKTDRPEADIFVKNLKLITGGNLKASTPVIKLVATQNVGIPELRKAIDNFLNSSTQNNREAYLLTEKAWTLLQQKRMKIYSKQKIYEEISERTKNEDFNLYSFIEQL